MSEENGLESTLIGYVRKSGQLNELKVSIDLQAINEAETYQTSDGRSYVPLFISLAALRKVLDGERAVTVIAQHKD